MINLIKLHIFFYFFPLILWKYFNIEQAYYFFCGWWYLISYLFVILIFTNNKDFIEIIVEDHKLNKNKCHASNYYIPIYIILTIISTLTGFYISSLISAIGIWKWANCFNMWSKINEKK